MIPESTPDHLKIVAYNLDQIPVKARMTGWEVDPGQWEMVQGTQDVVTGAVQGQSTRTAAFERSKEVEITFPPHQTTVIEMKLVTKGVPYWSRPDLGIDPEDVKVEGGRMKVTVHSVGSIDAPAATVVLRDKDGKVLGQASVPALKAPIDLLPKTATVTIAIPGKAEWKGGSVTVEVEGGGSGDYAYEQPGGAGLTF